jgi:hypothetical protein
MFLLLVNFARWKQVEIQQVNPDYSMKRLLGMMVKFGKNLFYFKNDKLLNKIQPILQRILRTL